MASPQNITTNHNSAIVAHLLEVQREKALEAGHAARRVDRAVALVSAGHVFDAGAAGEWIVFSAQADVTADAFEWRPGVGRPAPAKRYTAAPQPADGQRACTCPDAPHRITSHSGKCKHQLAAIMAANIRRRLADPDLFAIPEPPAPAPAPKLSIDPVKALIADRPLVRDADGMIWA